MLVMTCWHTDFYSARRCVGLAYIQVHVLLKLLAILWPLPLEDKTSAYLIALNKDFYRKHKREMLPL